MLLSHRSQCSSRLAARQGAAAPSAGLPPGLPAACRPTVLLNKLAIAAAHHGCNRRQAGGCTGVGAWDLKDGVRPGPCSGLQMPAAVTSKRLQRRQVRALLLRLLLR